MVSTHGEVENAGRLVGVVLRVPEPYADRLQQWRRSFGDPMADVIPPHITLVTTTPTQDWAAVLKHVRRVAAQQQSFQVKLSGSGSFRPVSPVVFVQVATGFAECAQLHEVLQSGPLARELPFPFHPHVTVAHDVPESVMDMAEQRVAGFNAVFEVSSMGLYEHSGDGEWQLHEELPFGG